MSARKSFDVRGSKSSPARKSGNSQVVARKRGRPRDRRPLKVRRREALKRTGVIFVISLIALAALGLFLLWRPEVRITRIEAGTAEDPAALEAIARKHLAGTYYLVFPRDSFFFYPERAIRADILASYPSASAFSISRIGFNAISLKISERLSAFLWCGEPGGEGRACYNTDAEGFVYSAADAPSASSTPELEVYANLESAEDMSLYPLRSRVEGAEFVPDILRFVRAVQSLGVVVERVAIRGDEADLITPEGVRIIYVIGNEEAAAASAAASFQGLNFKDGTLDYVDLRFDGKVYVKRVGG